MKSARLLMLKLFLLFSIILASQTLFAEAIIKDENKSFIQEELVILNIDYENIINIKPLIPPSSNLIKNTIYYKEENGIILISFKKDKVSEVRITGKNNLNKKWKPSIRAPTIQARRKTC